MRDIKATGQTTAIQTEEVGGQGKRYRRKNRTQTKIDQRRIPLTETYIETSASKEKRRQNSPD